MIALEVQYGVTTKVKISGHSPTAIGSKGENLLCAGVSVLAQSVFLYFWKLQEIQSYKKDDGLLEFEVSNSISSKVGLEILLVGFQDLQTQYPSLISIKIGEENGT